jgi:branched-chain amino acid transport system ATP-binding protein
MRLALNGVTAGYGGMTAVRDVSLTVPAGKVVALLGPNGAGKTTLLRLASNVLRPRHGRVLLDDEDVTGISPETLARRGVCHVTEGRAVFPSMTVRDNLRLYALKGDGGGVERALAAFPKLGLRLNQVAGTLSGGEQQMLAVARAYARPTQVVLADELSMGLAPIVVDEIFEHLSRLVAVGCSLLIVEQYVSRALEIADYVYLLARGRVVFAGEPAEAARTDLFAAYLGAETIA